MILLLNKSFKSIIFIFVFCACGHIFGINYDIYDQEVERFTILSETSNSDSETSNIDDSSDEISCTTPWGCKDRSDSLQGGSTTSESAEEDYSEIDDLTIKGPVISIPLNDSFGCEIDNDREKESPRKRKLSEIGLYEMARCVSDATERFFESQTTDFYPAVQEYIQCVSVDTFLRKCEGFLDNNYYPEPFFCLPRGYRETDIITVTLKENNKLKHYRVYDPYHRLMNGEEFCPADRPLGGTRKTGFYSIAGKRRLFFKQWPEAPEREYAVYKLYQQLFPEDQENLPLPKSRTILMKDKVFLVSEYMEGETLEAVLDKVKEDPEYGKEWIFNAEKFQKLVYFSSLISPEDGRPQNYLIRKIKGSDEYEFVLVDNERTFGEHESIEYDHPEEGRIKTRVHCALLCFYEILLKKNVNTGFSKSHKLKSRESIKNNIKRWIGDCWVENKYQRQLQSLLRKEDLFKSTLGIFYNHTLIKKISIKLHRFDKALSISDRSFANIFWDINPELAGIYRIPTSYAETESLENPLQLARERIHEIDEGRAGLTTPKSAYVPLDKYFGIKDFYWRSPSLDSIIFNESLPISKIRRQVTV